MNTVRLHPLHFTKFIRYGFVLCVFPVLRALLVFDIAAAWTAFTQSALILIAVTILAWLLWNHSEISLDATCFSAMYGLIIHRTDTFARDRISAVVVSRPISYRLLGAARLTLYFKSEKPLASISFTLPRAQAERFACELLPAVQKPSVFEPAGFDRFLFVMLSANVIATSILSVMTAYRVTKMLGQDFETAAITGLSQAAELFSAWLPAGVSALVTLVVFFALLSVLRGLFSTTGFTVSRSGGILVCRGGLLTKTERRIAVSAINASTLHITPWARILRRYPVYITAGGFRGHELPLIAVKKGDEKFLTRILPEFCLPEKKMCNPRRKNWVAYFGKPGGVAGALIVLWLVSRYALPALSSLLALLFFISLGPVIIAAEAFFREGICKNTNRTFSLSYSRFFTRYLVSVYTNDLSFELKMHALAAAEGRCDLKVRTPSHITYRLRGLEYSEAKRLKFNI